ncbi:MULTISPECIES: ABC transporter substrate-binding protein [Pseudonocardia]|uniref:ABC transporter substrate-binding protein n=1 Tax=Pseudonocardia TaxID=1847 RepID=UPI00092013CC|nr:extracellular solute-binding protein [Pseudonocardia sp. SID8383]OJG05916.1 Bacterial extracellular solute-binding protein [Pseudonocardia autotrophica]
MSAAALTSRRGFLGLAAAAATASLVGCGRPQAGTGDLVLEFPSWQAEEGSFAPWWRELVAAYEQRNPGIRINLYPMPFDSYADQLTIRFAANQRPDILHLPARNAAEFAGRGWLESLQTRLDDTDIVSSWTPLQEEMATGGDHYGVLLLGYGYSLYCNESLLRAAGHTVPRTTEELLAAAEAVTGDGIYGFGATTTQNPDNYTELAAFVVGTGGSLFDGDRVTATTPETIRGLDAYRRAVAQAPRGIQSQQRNELFRTGKIAMLLEGPFFASELEDAEERVRPSLTVARAPFVRTPGGTSNSIHIPEGTDPRRADAAWELIRLACSPEWQRRYRELTGNPVPRRNLGDEPPAGSELALVQELADEAISIFPDSEAQRERFGRISDIVAAAAVSLITGREPTTAIAGTLQDQLEEAVRP